MSEDICKYERPFPPQAGPRRSQEIQLPTVQQVICSEYQFEESHPNSQWGETAQVPTVQLFMQPVFQPKKAYQKAHGGKKIQLQPM